MKNEYYVTWKLYRTWAAESMLKGKNLAFLISWIILGLVSLGLIFTGSFVAFFLVIAVLCFYRAFFRNLLLAGKQFKTMARTYGKETWIRTITFEEEQITLSEETFCMHFAYGDIADIQEKGNTILLALKNKTCIRLYRDAFAEGDWHACKAKIIAKQNQNE